MTNGIKLVYKREEEGERVCGPARYVTHRITTDKAVPSSKEEACSLSEQQATLMDISIIIQVSKSESESESESERENTQRRASRNCKLKHVKKCNNKLGFLLLEPHQSKGSLLNQT